MYFDFETEDLKNHPDYDFWFEEYESEWGETLTWDSQAEDYIQTGEKPWIPAEEGGYAGCWRDANGAIWVSGDTYVTVRYDFIDEMCRWKDIINAPR